MRRWKQSFLYRPRRAGKKPTLTSLVPRFIALSVRSLTGSALRYVMDLDGNAFSGWHDFSGRVEPAEHMELMPCVIRSFPRAASRQRSRLQEHGLHRMVQWDLTTGACTSRADHPSPPCADGPFPRSKFVHYIPVLPDLSDLYDKIEWAQTHDLEARRIQAAGKEMVKRVIKDDQMDAYYFGETSDLSWLCHKSL